MPDPPPQGFAELAPDLVVEVLSRDDRPGEVVAKVAADSLVSEHGVLDGENVVPGFTCPLGVIV